MFNQSSFQKNAFVKVNNNNNQIINNDPNKLGRRTVDEIKQDMLNIQHRGFFERQNANKQEQTVKNDNMHKPINYQERINNLRNINRD